MLDTFCIFTKGGALLWTIQLAALRGDPVNALIRSCLLEERLGESSFSYTPPSGSAYTMKWTLHNVRQLLHRSSIFFVLLCYSSAKASSLSQGLGLVFVAVYQRALKLLYVDELLERVKQEFAQQYKPDQVSGLPLQQAGFTLQSVVTSNLVGLCSSSIKRLRSLSDRCSKMQRISQISPSPQHSQRRATR